MRSICGIGNSSQQTSLQHLSTTNMAFSNEDKILIKTLYLKGYTAKRLTGEFPEKSWTKCGVNKLLKKFDIRATNATTQQPALFSSTHTLSKKTTMPSYASIF